MTEITARYFEYINGILVPKSEAEIYKYVTTEQERKAWYLKCEKEARADLVAYRHIHPKLSTTRATTLTMRRELKMLRESQDD